MNDDPEKLLKDVRRILDEQNRNLDGSTLSSLNRARQRALETRKNRRTRFWGWPLVPVTGAALLVLFLRQPTDFGHPSGDEISDLQILTSEESLEFFQEDMAFYEWIEEVMENESVHYDNNDATDNTNTSVVSAATFEGGTESSTDRKAGSRRRVFGISRFI